MKNPDRLCEGERLAVPYDSRGVQSCVWWERKAEEPEADLSQSTSGLEVQRQQEVSPGY